MAKFDLKSLKTKPLNVQKDIDNTEKNRIIEKPVSKPAETKEPEIKKPVIENENKSATKSEAEKPQKESKKEPHISPVENVEKTHKKEGSTEVDKAEKTSQKTDSKQSETESKISLEAKKSNDDLISLKDETSPTSVSSFTLPEDIKNYLKYMPKMKGMTLPQFLGEIFIAEQEKYIKAGIDLNAEPDFTKMANIKIRSRSNDLCVVPLKLRKTQNAWLKKAALYNGENVSQFMEKLIRQSMKK